MTPRTVLITYATQLTGNRAQACKIVDHVMLEGAKILVDTKDAEAARAFIFVQTRNKCYEYNERTKNKTCKRLLAYFKGIMTVTDWCGTR